MMQARRGLVLAAAASLLAWGCGDEVAEADSARSADTRAEVGDLDCGVGGGAVQIDRGVGVLRIGASVDSVGERCRVVRDTTILDNEAMPARQLAILIGGDSVVAEVVSDSVWRVRLTSERFRAGDGLGVGTSIATLAAIPGARALVGEGEIYVTVPGTCGVSYRVAGVDFARVAAARSAEQGMELLPDTARVDLLLVVDCPEPPDT